MSYSDEMADNPVGREEDREARGYPDPIVPRYGTPSAETLREHAGLHAQMAAPEEDFPDRLRSPFSPFPTPVPRPAEPEVGTVLGFTKHYSEDGQGYSFAAIRATNRRTGWYLSGPQYSGKVYTWDALLDFIGGPAEWFRVGVVKEWTPLGGQA